MKFVIAGRIADPEYHRSLLLRIDELGLGERKVFIGHTDDIFTLLNRLDVVVHMATDEPFGRAVAEGMISGKAVVAYGCGGPSEIISDGMTGVLVEPRSVEGLATAVVRLLEDPPGRERIGEEARRYACRAFDIKEYVRRWERLADSVTTERTGPKRHSASKPPI